jgi:SWI/SNF-related matrix-associated actin-dependent regulator 1 of chromatin subfamily A
MWASQPYKLFIAHGTKFRIPPDTDIVVCNYDLVTHDWPVAELNRYQANFVVLDESHYLKNYKAKRTKNVLGKFIKDMKGAKGVARYADRVIAVSGTPIVNRPIEFWPILSAFAKEALTPYDDFLKFGKRYCGAYRDGFGWVMSGHSNEEELNRRLRSSVMIRRLKSEVLKQLPEKQWQLIELEGDKDTELLVRKEYQLVQASQMKELNGVIPRLDAEDLDGIDPNRPIIAQLAEMRQEVALAKMPICLEHIENLLQGVDKLVVFAVHRSVIKSLQMELAKYNPVVIDGSVTQAVRNRNVDVFQSDPHCRVLIGNIQAAGVGLTLTAASNVVFVEITWVPGELDQAIDRCHRIGQKNNVLAQFLMLKDSVDQMLLRKIMDKQKVLQKVLK